MTLLLIIGTLDRLRDFLLPRGRHRAGDWWPLPGAPLEGHTATRARPYASGPQQRLRRRELWFATYGIDIGPHRIHGVQVTA